MANKNIQISADVQVRTQQATADLKKLSKQIENSFKQTGINKFVAEFQKISPLVKDVDKKLNDMLKGLSKDEARKQLVLMEKALKGQASQLDSNIKKYKELTEQISKASGAQAKALIAEREMTVKGARENLGRMQQYGERRDEAKATLGKSPIDYIKLGAAIAGSMRVASSILNYSAGKDFRSIGYKTQKDSFENQYLGDLTSGSLNYGIIKASGKFDRGMFAANKQTAAEIGGKGLVAGGDAVGAGVAGGGIGGAAGAIGGILSALGMHASEGADMATMQEKREAMLAANRTQMYDAQSQRMAFVTGLANERQGAARGRMSAFEAQGSSSWQNINLGRRRGFGEDEINSAMGILGQSGALGSERGNAKSLFDFQRRGLADIGQSGNILAGTVNALSNQQKTVAAFEKAMERGSKKGLETSIVKDLVGATVEIANSTGQRVSELDTFQRLMESALGGKAASEIGRADIKSAKGVVEQYMDLRGGGNNPVALAMQMQGMKTWLSETGISGVGQSELMSLAQAGSFNQLTDMQKNMLYAHRSPNDKRSKADFLGQIESSFNLEHEAKATAAEGSGLGADIEALGSAKKIAEFRRKIAAGDPEALALKERLPAQYQNALGISRVAAEQKTNMMAGLSMPNIGGSQGQEDITAKTLDRALAQMDSGAKAVRDSLLGQEETAKLLKSAMEETTKSWKEMLSPGNSLIGRLEGGEMGLRISMEMLEAAVRQNTSALLGRHTEPFTPAANYTQKQVNDFIQNIEEIDEKIANKFGRTNRPKASPAKPMTNSK